MLRAVRFAATYGFRVDENTLAAIKQQHSQISIVSAERITNELERMLTDQNRCSAVRLLAETMLIFEILPEVASLLKGPSEDWSKLLAILDALEEPAFATVLAALFSTAGTDVDGVEDVCRRLKTSNNTRKATMWIVKNEPRLRSADQLRFSELQPLLIQDEVSAALNLSKAIIQATGESTAGLELCLRKLQLPPEQLDPEPWIRGEELSALGAEPGPDYARVLRAVRCAQLDGLVADKAAALELASSELARSKEPGQ